ncbi:hypothetical protein D3C87_1902150 [compost metagenome]
MFDKQMLHFQLVGHFRIERRTERCEQAVVLVEVVSVRFVRVDRGVIRQTELVTVIGVVVADSQKVSVVQLPVEPQKCCVGTAFLVK